MSWGSLRKGQPVRFYTCDGWKKGVVGTVYLNSCSILWSSGSTHKTTRVYDTRNVKPI